MSIANRAFSAETVESCITDHAGRSIFCINKKGTAARSKGSDLEFSGIVTAADRNAENGMLIRSVDKKSRTVRHFKILDCAADIGCNIVSASLGAAEGEHGDVALGTDNKRRFPSERISPDDGIVRGKKRFAQRLGREGKSGAVSVAPDDAVGFAVQRCHFIAVIDESCPERQNTA